MSDPRSRPPRRKLDGILLLDKPLGISSNQALQQAKRLFRAEKAGHTGNLDPLATGLLPVCFGEATKLSGLLLDADKRYIATARFGEKTSTGDAEGVVIATSDASTLDDRRLAGAIARFTGPIRQIPPMHSALKRDGRPLYELAREGVEVDREPRDVVIHAIEVLSRDGRDVVLDVRCSKGTYIRTLVEDVAASAGQCAHLAALRRTEAGPFGGRPMWTLEAIERLDGDSRDALLLPLVAAVGDWPQVRLDPGRIDGISKGRAVPCTALPVDVDIAILDDGGVLRAVGRADGRGSLAPRRWLGGETRPATR